MNSIKKIFAAKLLGIKAIKIQPEKPFTWASGWLSPFYCDNRKALSYPELRNFVKLELCRTILEEFPEAEAIAGVATGAISLVVWQLNVDYSRSRHLTGINLHRLTISLNNALSLHSLDGDVMKILSAESTGIICIPACSHGSERLHIST